MIKSSCASWSNICHHEEPSAATPQLNFGLSPAKPCDPRTGDSDIVVGSFLHVVQPSIGYRHVKTF
jgi:hypothetical protein